MAGSGIPSPLGTYDQWAASASQRLALPIGPVRLGIGADVGCAAGANTQIQGNSVLASGLTVGMEFLVFYRLYLAIALGAAPPTALEVSASGVDNFFVPPSLLIANAIIVVAHTIGLGTLVVAANGQLTGGGPVLSPTGQAVTAKSGSGWLAELWRGPI